MRNSTIILLLISSLAFAQADSSEVIFEEVSDDILVDDVEVPEDESQEVFEMFDVQQKASFGNNEDSIYLFIAQNTKYPNIALENNIQGTVMLSFIVDHHGEVKDIKVLSSELGFGLEQEAIRVISLTSGHWNPALMRDRPVSMRFRLPVKFILY
ncbi:MAG: energy transducer TonB [Bacteroidia bacterium]